jgi:hypothetical protein
LSEGETEELLVPRVRDRLRLTDERGIVRSAVMRGTKTGLTKLVGFAAGPLIEGQQGEDWLLMRPPTRVFVAVDPDDPFDTTKKVEDERRKMLDEIVAVVRAQGVEPNRNDLDSLVRIETWGQSCFEFAHFTNEELALAIHAIHPTCGGLSITILADALEHQRQSGQDIKQVWSKWRPKPSKRVLADRLWPILESKIDSAEQNPSISVPEVVLRVQDAHREALLRPTGRWVLRGRPV